MLVKKVTYFGEFGYLNSLCIIVMFFLVPRVMFLLVSGRHVSGPIRTGNSVASPYESL